MENDVGLTTTIVWVVVCTCLAFPLHYFLHYWDRDIYRRWRLDVDDPNVTEYHEGNWHCNQLAIMLLFFAPFLVFCHFYPEQGKGFHLTPMLLWFVPNLAGFFFWVLRHFEQDIKRQGAWRRGATGPVYPGFVKVPGLKWRLYVLAALVVFTPLYVWIFFRV